ncbi:hypothetical protein KIL84_015352, partial [Mauremys mutica]
MDIKDRRHRSLTRGRCGKECRYTSSSLDSEDCRVPTQKSYSSSETLKAYDHDTRMHYGNRVSDLVHRESDEFPRQVHRFRYGNTTTRGFRWLCGISSCALPKKLVSGSLGKVQQQQDQP